MSSEPRVDTSPDPAEAFRPNRRRFLVQLVWLSGPLALGPGRRRVRDGADRSSSAAAAAPRAGPARPGRPCSSSSQSGVPTSFNPLGATPAFPTNVGHMQLIYETLLRFDLLDGSLKPGLAKELQTPDPSTLVLPLQDGTKWSDGTELTADDVVFTFELAKKQTVNYSNVWTYLESVEAPDAADGAVHREDEALQPGLGQGRHRQRVHRAPARLRAARRQGDERRQPEAGRQRAVHAGPLRPDPDQPQAVRRLLGQGGLRHAGHDDDQPPDLQEQQRLRPQARGRRARRRPDLHRADLDDVGEGQAGRHLAQGEAVLPARATCRCWRSTAR